MSTKTYDIIKSGGNAFSPEQLRKVFGWILDGASEYQILQAIAATWPDAPARPLVIAAMANVCESAEADPNVIRGWCIEASRLIYQQAMKSKDLDVALRAVAQMHRLSVA